MLKVTHIKMENELMDPENREKRPAEKFNRQVV
jgi:hypothetical protein